MAQTYSPEDDREQIHYLCELMSDPRYLRVNGRPLLLIYRTESLPDPRRTADLWRSEALRLGIGELLLGTVESFTTGRDPRAIGFDVAVEFAPDWRLLRGRLNESRLEGAVRWRTERLVDRVRPDRPTIVDYDRVMDRMLAKPPAAYPFVRCACPSWDNTPRRKVNPTILRGATPVRYGAWLERLLRTRQTQYGYRAPVFVNAWNEWAEGAILEPCDQFGSAFLEATRDAIQRAGQGA